MKKNNEEFDSGIEALSKIIAERARRASIGLDELFSDVNLLRRLCKMSGGHVRSLFLLIRSAIERSDGLPITRSVLERTIKRHAIDISLPLGGQEWDALRKIHHNKRAFDDDLNLWYNLLRDLFVFAYEDDQGQWYDWNPLLSEVSAGAI